MVVRKHQRPPATRPAARSEAGCGGFRIASVPKPSTWALLLTLLPAGLACGGGARRNRRHAVVLADRRTVSVATDAISFANRVKVRNQRLPTPYSQGRQCRRFWANTAATMIMPVRIGRASGTALMLRIFSR